jgi:DNA-binding transcriptional regulator YiaG
MKITTRNLEPVILADDGSVLEAPAGIRAVKDRLGLTHQALADLCGVSRRTVENWTQGRHNPTPAALAVLAAKLEEPRAKPKT